MSAEPTAAAAQAEARVLMRKFDTQMLAHGVEKAELLAAGVPFAKAEALYPFEIDDYQPFIIVALNEPRRLLNCAMILGGTSLMGSFVYLHYEAYDRAENTVWTHKFFDFLPKELSGLVAEVPPVDAINDAEENINGNAVYCMRQWGYLLLFLHECAVGSGWWEEAAPEELAKAGIQVGPKESFFNVFNANCRLANRLLAVLSADS